MGLFGRNKRQRRTTPDVEEAKAREMVATSNAKVAVINALVKDRPDVLALMLFPRLAKSMAANGSGSGGEALQQLMLKKLEADMAGDPMDKMLDRMLKLRDLQEEIAPTPRQAPPADSGAGGVVAGIFDSLFNSPFGANMGAAIGDAMAKQNGQAGQGQQQAEQPVAAAPAPEGHQLPPGNRPPAALPAAAGGGDGSGPQPPNPLLVRGIMALLKRQAPPRMAEWFMSAAESNDQLEGILEVMVNANPDELVTLLEAFVDLPGWGEICRWLLANPDYTGALAAELRRLATEETEEEPEAGA